MTINKTALAVAFSTIFLTACSSMEEKQQGLSDSELAAENNASTRGLNDNASLSGEQLGTQALGSADATATRLGAEFSDPNNPLSQSTIYFMFDSSQIQQDFIPVVAAHAQYLLSHPNQKVMLEGHADERGSREYNIALGEQRAKSVYRLMKVQGVSDAQLEIVSYGEEKPAAQGMDEASWQLNRRTEIAYQVQ